MITAQKRKQMNPLLLKVIIASVLLHVVAGIIFSFITIAQIIIQEDAAFEEPPVIEEEKPPPDVKVQIKPQPAQMNKQMNSLRMKQVGNISVANVDVSLPSMQDSFTVSAGIGNFRSSSLMGGTRGSIGMGMSDISVFGLKTRAERILFMIDANRMMMTDNKGGLNSYKVIKEEIATMVGNLSAGTLFNVILYDDFNTKFFKPGLITSGDEITEELRRWLKPINSSAKKVGLPKTPQRPLKTLPNEKVAPLLTYHREIGNLNLYMAHLALEQNVDAVFIITGRHRGFEQIRRPMNDKEKREWDKHANSKKYQEQLKAHIAEIPEVRRKVLAEVKKINAKRKSQGLPDIVLRGDDPRHWAGQVGVDFQHRHPGWPPAKFIDAREGKSYMRKLIDHLYTDRNMEKPSVNVILFLAEDENFAKEYEKNLGAFCRFYGGRDRIIRGGKQIKSARSAAKEDNKR